MIRWTAFPSAPTCAVSSRHLSLPQLFPFERRSVRTDHQSTSQCDAYQVIKSLKSVREPAKMASLGTWHAHIYDTPPKQPTPYFVATILGLDATHMPVFTTRTPKSKTALAESNGLDSDSPNIESKETTSGVKKSEAQSQLSDSDKGK